MVSSAGAELLEVGRIGVVGSTSEMSKFLGTYGLDVPGICGPRFASRVATCD